MNLTECVPKMCSLSGLGVPGFEGFEMNSRFCMVEMFRPKNMNFTDAVAED